MQALADDLQALLDHLNAGKSAAAFAAPDHEAFRQCLRELGLLTNKTTLYCANVDEASLADPSANPHVAELRRFAAARGNQVVVVCAKIEEELQGLSEAEALEMLSSYGIQESGLVKVIRAGYRSLDLASYFTAGPKEVKAWTITQGCKAPQAAGVIHTDFERGFIRAEVIAYDDYVRLGSEAAARAAGLLRVEGKEYVVKDGDVMHFLFNV
jgi:ribosome-binding ATPase YchF (GTP1/OBG family)